MSNESMRRDAWKIIRKTLKEAMPDQAVEKALRARSFTKPVTLFSIGKAAWKMPSAAERSLGNQIKQGIVLTKYGHTRCRNPRFAFLFFYIFFQVGFQSINVFLNLCNACTLLFIR